MSAAAPQPNPKPPKGELGMVTSGVPSWDILGKASVGAFLGKEYVPDLQWPTSVRVTYPRMRNDTQLSGLMRGTTLPIRRYVWGIDANGADPKHVASVCRDWNLEQIADAWTAYTTGESAPIPRARNQVALDKHWADVFRALYLGHYFFEKVGGYGDGGPQDDGLWHPEKLLPIAPDTITQFFRDGNDFAGVKQMYGLDPPLLDAIRLVPYVFDQEGGDPTGRSMFRACYREWLIKDRLLRVDVVNHERAGGVWIPEAPEGATQAEITALAEMSTSVRVSENGGGALPPGAKMQFFRATGSDVIGSINRHDESMAREFLMMFMALGTSSSGGNRALASSFIDWFAISQETIAIWARDVFNEHVIKPYIDWNFGTDVEFLPRLAFRRPEAANPLDALANAAAAPAGTPGALVAQTPDGQQAPVAAVRFGPGGAFVPGFGPVVIDEETREEIRAAHADYETWAGRGAKPSRPLRARGAGSAWARAAAEKTFRRLPTAVEVRAAVDFAALDANWVSAVDQLVAAWKTIRSAQVTELHDAIVAANGDLTVLATLEATAAGGDTIAAQLTQMAHTGAAEAVAEASRQGVAANLPDMATLAAELEARASALEQILARALSGALSTKAVQLTGTAAAPASVAADVVTYVEGLSDAYLTDQFGGALSAAQNSGRLAAMSENNASSYYASELLDSSTCDPCAAVDGKQYASAADAAADYPAGYGDCEGGPRCRGTVVAVYSEAAPSV